MTVILLLITIHFIADFMFQTDWMAMNKSSNWRALLTHCAIYGAAFVGRCGFEFALLAFASHVIVDGVSSRITKRLWQANERHWFFVVIGADQLVHFYILVGLAVLLHLV